jgi:tetratricopeptide (TPR) repeat protein
MATMHNNLLYQFYCWEDKKSVYSMLEDYDDIDILDRNGTIIRLAISYNDVETLKAALDYFENRQFPNKDEKYIEANRKLIEIMEDAIDGEGPSPGIRAIIAEYQAIDVAPLCDVYDSEDEEDVDELASMEYVGKYGVTVSAAALKNSNIEDCVFAAKEGNVETIKNKLDMTNRSLKLLVISTAVQKGQDAVIDTMVDIVENNHKKATILRAAGDMCTKNSLFQKAEEYYNKSLELHPNYYVTYSKLGALYQRWSFDTSSEANQEVLKQKAIENYNIALERKPVHIKYKEVQDKLDLLSKQLEFLRLSEHTEASDTESYDATEELLSPLSDDEDDVDLVGGAADYS